MKEIRSFSNCQLRAVDDEKRVIEGYAVVFNQRSVLLTDYNIWKKVEEVILPEAISEELLRSSDVMCNLEHNPNRMIARCVNGVGSLTLTKDDKGIKYRFEAPNTPDGITAYEGIKRGDYFGSSFAYSNDENEVNVVYSKDGDTLVRTVKKIDHLYDVAIVRKPAYLGTTADVRAAQEQELKDAIKRSVDDFASEDPKKTKKPDEAAEKRAAQMATSMQLAIAGCDSIAVELNHLTF